MKLYETFNVLSCEIVAILLLRMPYYARMCTVCHLVLWYFIRHLLDTVYVAVCKRARIHCAGGNEFNNPKNTFGMKNRCTGIGHTYGTYWSMLRIELHSFEDWNFNQGKTNQLWNIHASSPWLPIAMYNRETPHYSHNFIQIHAYCELYSMLHTIQHTATKYKLFSGISNESAAQLQQTSSYRSIYSLTLYAQCGEHALSYVCAFIVSANMAKIDCSIRRIIHHKSFYI